MQTRKYAFRNSPPYPANQCKSMKKRGNDGAMYVSQADKNGTYKWVPVSNAKSKATLKNKAAKATSKEIQMLAKKYMVSPSERLLPIKQTDASLNNFLKRPRPLRNDGGLSPHKAL